MKRLFFTITACCLAFAGLHAEDVLQIKPTQITPGKSGSSTYQFKIEMNNEHTFVGLQFDLWLPEGVSITNDDIKKTTRLPNVYDEDEGTSTREYRHTTTCVKQAGGQYRVTCSTTSTDNQISGNDGVLFNVRYTSAADMPTGILPVRITDVVLAIDGNHDVKPADCVSFFYTPDVDFAALASIDLTTVEGIATADVAAAARALMTNPNSLLMLNEGSHADGLDNVVVGGECANLVLTDGQPFCSPAAFTAANATYSRTVAADGWCSLCLPFAAATPAGVAVERFVSLDEDNKVACFASGAIEADKPCIFSAEAGTVAFAASNAAIAATPTSLADGKLTGTYTGMAAGTLTGCYALRADGAGFGVCSATAYSTPFRAVMSAAAGGAMMIRVAHDGETTGIAATAAAGGAAGVYSLDGRRLAQPAKGISIVNGKKTLMNR